MQKIKNILFDFDGVLADSVQVKSNAFFKLYIQYGDEIANEVLSHHEKNGGMSRYTKFKHYHKEYLNIDLTEDGITELSNSFSDLVVNDVIKSNEVPGALWFLSKYSKDLNFWIVSATPTAEVKMISEKRKISHHFLGIYGSPIEKSKNVKSILEENNLQVSNTVFLGDALNDYHAAKQNGIHFFLRQTSYNIKYFSKFKDLSRFKDFFELDKIIGN